MDFYTSAEIFELTQPEIISSWIVLETISEGQNPNFFWEFVVRITSSQHFETISPCLSIQYFLPNIFQNNRSSGWMLKDSLNWHELSFIIQHCCTVRMKMLKQCCLGGFSMGLDNTDSGFLIKDQSSETTLLNIFKNTSQTVFNII